MRHTVFTGFCICHIPSDGTIMKVVLRDLDLLSRSNVSKVNILKTVKASVKMRHTGFIDFSFYRRMAQRCRYLLGFTVTQRGKQTDA